MLLLRTFFVVVVILLVLSVSRFRWYAELSCALRALDAFFLHCLLHAIAQAYVLAELADCLCWLLIIILSIWFIVVGRSLGGVDVWICECEIFKYFIHEQNEWRCDAMRLPCNERSQPEANNDFVRFSWISWVANKRNRILKCFELEMSYVFRQIMMIPLRDGTCITAYSSQVQSESPHWPYSKRFFKCRLRNTLTLCDWIVIRW